MIFFAPLEHRLGRMTWIIARPSSTVIKTRIGLCVESGQESMQGEGGRIIRFHQAPVPVSAIARCISTPAQAEPQPAINVVAAVAVAAMAVRRPGQLWQDVEIVNKGLTGSATPLGDVLLEEPLINVAIARQIQGQMKLSILVSFHSVQFGQG